MVKLAMNEIIKIDNVVKEYRLGAIGGGTLKNDLQTFFAKLRHKEDPNSLVGTKQEIHTGERFRTLDGVSFTVNQGEAVGIIGHNGAGKSTLLKLLSRVTAPTSGTISYNGRIASMLEVGTGFHPELTGRENIYMNGAILGMTKREISSKFDEIVRFAEMERFIDTPVKRYSSGMYVKLAFAVAAHLDSEIMVMDEVLAVGDMKFQQKCLGKMDDAAANHGKTVLYVSHNMNTIRQLCTRCIVLDHGKLIYDGNTDDAIAVYSDASIKEKFNEKDLTHVKRYEELTVGRSASFTYLRLLESDSNSYKSTDTMKLQLTIDAEREIKNASLRLVFKGMGGYSVAFSMCKNFATLHKGENVHNFILPLQQFTKGNYEVTLVLLELNEFGASTEIDVAYAFSFEIEDARDIIPNPWAWGFVRLPDMNVE